jgi:predicted acylesterase/phospholipase RssA
VGLALAGGGPLGAIYEIGALCALEEALDGADFTRFDHYVGVSAGAFIAAGLANGWRPRELCAGFIENSGSAEIFDPAWLTVPAHGEYLRRAMRLPGLVVGGLWGATWGRKTLLEVLEGFGPAIPTGLFSSEEVHRRLHKLFARRGRSNDFRALRSRLHLVATALDTAEPVAFGSPGWDHVPISRAVQASCALPGMFPPVEIDGRMFVDGALTKTMHASLALDAGVDLMLCINPLVPFERPGMAGGGLPAVLSQTFRTLIHSRLRLAMKQYEVTYPDTDIVLVEPHGADVEIFHANTFSYAQRRRLAEHAYQQTRAWLRAEQARLAPMLARHGVTLRPQALRDDGRQLVSAPVRPRRLGAALTRLHAVLDDLDGAVRLA